MDEAKSFLSEHTVEFSLVLAIKKLLIDQFEFAVPIYPWMGRELGKLSKLIHGGESFRVLAIFPRRPKLTAKFSDGISIKVNYELYEFEEKCREFGIPVIIGCPLVYNLWELGNTPQIVWFNLAGLNEGMINVTGEGAIGIGGDGILDLVQEARVLCFSDFDKFLRYVKKDSYSFYGSTYKPFYFLIK
ncbi:MAG: hypothetical protein KKC24_20655 [Gammaproteobacteria bacterium]|nr:hypothetical protein [Gammaproteobacteria bacterium]MBU0821260.1 hypothetical protein [Gammaproteobacteria bacterium]MBU0840377.1 hypothetical protein [Gammaproteobacteria bacterium]MBU1841473.1 hypothetical protein [Gammaproteobacteria bacterium]